MKNVVACIVNHKKNDGEDDGYGTSGGVMQRLECHGLNRLLAATHRDRDGWMQLSQVSGSLKRG